MKNILIFQHIPREHASNIATYAHERGIGLDTVELWGAATIPALSSYDGLVVLGGSMGVYEDYPNKREELRALSSAIGTIPVLGICLGAQLVAHALGAAVYPHTRGGKHIKEIGHYGVELTAYGKASPLFKNFPDEMQVLQWHGDTFDVPMGAELLATAPLVSNQAFAHGSAYGLQFHIEATPLIVKTWLEDDSAWTHKDFDISEEKIMQEAHDLSTQMKEHCYRLMDNFLSV